MWVFPLTAAGVSFVFAGMLGRRWALQHRGYQGMWVVALVMYGVASLALALGTLSGWSEASFRLYWLFGAILNVPYLAQGELMLLSRRRVLVNSFMGLLLAGTAIATWAVFSDPIDPVALEKAIPLGKEAFGTDSVAYRMAQVFAYPAYLYLVVASIWSAVRMRGRPELRNRSVGAVWIAVGATVVAIGSGAGAFWNLAWLFSLGLAVGIAMMFWGFLRASRPAVAEGNPGV